MTFLTPYSRRVQRGVYVGSIIGKVYDIIVQGGVRIGSIDKCIIFLTPPCRRVQRGVYVGSRIGKLNDLFDASLYSFTERRIYIQLYSQSVLPF
jgi:CRISPR/Cas system-associated endoribonuclease Cas2